jgi:hypothetical protein
MDPSAPNQQYQPSAAPVNDINASSPMYNAGPQQPLIPGQQVQAGGGPAPYAMPTNGQPAAPPKPVAHPNSTQNSLQVAEVRDGIVIMNDGSFRSVVMVKSINFDLMSPQEQESVEYAYQGF